MTWNPAERIRLVALALEADEYEAPKQVDLGRVLFVDAWGSLANFMQQLWYVLRPGVDLEWNWHLDLICRELERVTEHYETGLPAKLLICIPPGMMKSFLVSVYWPAWWWLRNPRLQFLNLSSSEELVKRDSARMREVVTSDWFLRLVAEGDRRGLVHQWGMDSKQAAKINFANSARGNRAAFTISGAVTGHRGDGLILDDPHQVKDMLGNPEQVSGHLEAAHNKLDVVLPSRVNDPKRAFEVLIMQRVHMDDAAGRRLTREGYRKVVLAMRYDPEGKHNHPEDPRTEAGELLHPAFMPEEIVEEKISTLDTQFPGQGEAQYNQNPVPRSGGLFKRDWMGQRYEFNPQQPWDADKHEPFRFTQRVLTIDATFKKSKGSDQVSLQHWGRRGWGGYYLLRDNTAKMSYVEMREAVKGEIQRFVPDVVLIEAKANGEALISDLQDEYGHIVVPFVPDTYGDKYSRAQIAAVAWNTATVWLPTEQWCPSIGEYITELLAFPRGTYDDRVDAMTQLFIWWGEQARGGDNETAANALAGALDYLGF